MKKNPFENSEKTEVFELNKSEIFDAMRTNSEKDTLVVTKTGKQIKEQINKVVYPKLNSIQQDLANKLNDLLKLTGEAPKKPYIIYYPVKIELPYNIYFWDEINYNEKSDTSTFNAFANVDSDEEIDAKLDDVTIDGMKISFPKSKEQSEARMKYNNLLRDIENVIVDQKTLDILLQVKDDQTFKLNIQQMMALMF